MHIKLNIINIKFQAELNFNNVKFQNKSSLLRNLKNGLFDYLVQKLSFLFGKN